MHLLSALIMMYNEYIFCCLSTLLMLKGKWMLDLTHSDKFLGCIITCCYCAYLSLIMLCGVNEVHKLVHVHFLSINKIFCEVLLSQIRVPGWLQTLASCNPPYFYLRWDFAYFIGVAERADSRGFAGALLSVEPWVFSYSNNEVIWSLEAPRPLEWAYGPLLDIETTW